MKTSKLLIKAKPTFQILCFIFCLFSSTAICANLNNDNTSTPLILSNVSGNIWVETDANSTYNGEAGPSDVLVYLLDNGVDTIVSQSITVAGKFEFNGIDAGKYYLLIDNSAFDLGGPLSGQQSCTGVNDANDMVDDDDNGNDSTPGDVLSSVFNLTNTDPMSAVSIEYIDFCFNFVCEDQNQITSTSCDAISALDVVCDLGNLDNFCATLPNDTSPGNQPTPLCDELSTSKNISWFAFVGAEGSYNMTIDAFDCQMGTINQQGIQIGIYTDCSFSELAFCSNICTSDPIDIGSSLLIPGQKYYLYINGCNENICSYQIDIDGDPSLPSLAPDDVCIFSGGSFQCEDLSYCPNADITFRGQGLRLTGTYTWSVMTLSGEPYLEDPKPTTTTSDLIINIPTEGVYEICLSMVENGCIDQTWTGSVCRTVTTSFAIDMPMDEDFGVFNLCADDLDDFTVFEFNSEDPNGDGDAGWNAALPDYSIGLNQGIAYTVGCSYQQEFTLSTFDPSPVEDVYISVCEEDFPIQIDAIDISVFSFGGQQTLVINNLPLVNSKDINGCDSIINLTVERLNILQGFLEEPICTADGIDLKFNYISDLSTDISFLEFVWTDPFGNLLPINGDPTTITAPFESGNGEYNLSVTINKDGASCDFFYSTFVEIALYLPPIPTVSGQNLVCSGNSPEIYLAQGDGDETSFIWSFPNDVTSAIISGAANEIITIDWAGSVGGEIRAIGKNTCGQSDPSSFFVQVIPTSTPSFTIDTSICIDNIATINFIGSNLNLVDYTWGFDGGNVISGAGMGPYEVSWSTPGDKLVSLVTTDANDCLSNTTVKAIPVQMPLAPTDVSCNPSIDEIEFTWEIPLFVSGFEVNVLSGQTGGVFTSTSFTISGLDEEEEVTIELLTMPEDPICGAFVSTIVSCSSFSCSTPIIELSADQSVCIEGENMAITATITSGETGTGVFSGPGIIDVSNGTFDPSAANLGTNTIQYSFTSDIGGCTEMSTIAIEVLDSPTSSLELSGDERVCIDGDNITVTATITSGETGTGVFSGPGIIDASNGIFDPSAANLGTNTIEYSFTSDISGCTGLSTIAIEVLDLPISSFTQDLDTMCITDIVNIDYNGTANVDSIDWDFDGGIGTGLLTNQNVIFGSSGIKTISLQVTKDGCVSDVFTSTILVEPSLDDIEIQCDSASTDFVIFSWNNIDEASGYEIQVDNNPVFSTTDTTIVIDQLAEDQEVTISITSLSSTSCQGSTASFMCMTTKTPVSVESQWLERVSIYPNPVRGMLFIDSPIDNSLSFELYSSLGDMIKKGQVDNESIDVSELSTGIYMIRVIDRESRLFTYFKVFKE